MTINHLPAIKAFCEERIKTLKRFPQSSGHEGSAERIDELKVVITLCDGLTKQNELLSKSLDLTAGRTSGRRE